MGGKRKRDTDPSIENRPIWHLRLNAQWPLEIAQCSENHAPQLWTRFKIPSMPLGATPATQSLPLWTLPNELLLQIFEHLSRVDRLFMALTCKRLLSVASMKRPFIPSAKKHRGVEHGCSAMLGILRVTKPTRHGLPDRSWATCCDCYRFRPKKKTYWTNIVRDRYHVGEYPHCKILLSFDRIVDRWSRKSSDCYQCPECWCIERLRKYGQPSDCKNC